MVSISIPPKKGPTAIPRLMAILKTEIPRAKFDSSLNSDIAPMAAGRKMSETVVVTKIQRTKGMKEEIQVSRMKHMPPAIKAKSITLKTGYLSAKNPPKIELTIPPKP